MRACSDCFAPGAASGLLLAEAEAGTCVLCLGFKQTWSAAAWAEVLGPILALYVPVDSGTSLLQGILTDWDVLSDTATEDPSPFLDQVCSVLGFDLQCDGAARLELGRPTAHELWESFRLEIGAGRRWFFKELDGRQFRRLLEICVTLRSEDAISGEHVFYRARVLPSGAGEFLIDDLAAPPPDRASGGRANPAGIRMLYAATSEEIAVHEVRPSRMSCVYTAEFRPHGEIALADFRPTSDRKPNPFGADEDGDPYSAAEIFVAVTLGTVVGKALSEPLAESDHRTEYLPTQYVAEYVRHSGRQGIRYGSSFCSQVTGLSGDNVVLFDPEVVRGVPESIRKYLVTGIGVTYGPYAS